MRSLNLLPTSIAPIGKRGSERRAPGFTDRVDHSCASKIIAFCRSPPRRKITSPHFLEVGWLPGRPFAADARLPNLGNGGADHSCLCICVSVAGPRLLSWPFHRVQADLFCLLFALLSTSTAPILRGGGFICAEIGRRTVENVALTQWPLAIGPLISFLGMSPNPDILRLQRPLAASLAALRGCLGLTLLSVRSDSERAALPDDCTLARGLMVVFSGPLALTNFSCWFY